MKKAIFFFAFTFVLSLAANAQSCQSAGKSCCAGKIAQAAAADPSIEKRTNTDGSVAYVRKEADAQGNVQFVSVQFDAASNKFVNVAPPAAAVGNESGMVKKSCTASETKACAGAAGAGKACCAKKAPGAASCSEAKSEQ